MENRLKQDGVSTNGIHKVDDYVIYKNNGICKIVEICLKDFSGEEKEYYHLQSVYDENTNYYIPLDAPENKQNMKHMLTIDEIDKIILDSEECENVWIEDSKERNEKFSEILREGKRDKILWLVKVLSLHKIKVEDEKKKFYATDEKILASAEKIITEEFAFVLGIEKQDVTNYIVEKITDIKKLEEEGA